jgi:hypothetical protein
MIQRNPIWTSCQHKSICNNPGTIGLYFFEPGETDVNLDKPYRVFCGRHKPKLNRRHRARLVPIRRGTLDSIAGIY